MGDTRKDRDHRPMSTFQGRVLVPPADEITDDSEKFWSSAGPVYMLHEDDTPPMIFDKPLSVYRGPFPALDPLPEERIHGLDIGRGNNETIMVTHTAGERRASVAVTVPRWTAGQFRDAMAESLGITVLGVFLRSLGSEA